MKYSFKQVRAAKGRLQSYTNRAILEKLFFDPLTWVVANFTKFTPNHLSIIGYLFGTLGAIFFSRGNFLLGAIGWELLNLFDTFDGRIARLKKTGSGNLGEYIDAYGGFWILFFLVIGLTIGLYNTYNNINLVFLCFILWFLMTIHFTESLLVGYLIGGGKVYKNKVSKHQITKKKSTIMNIFNPLFKFQIMLTKKFGLEVPFNMTDIEHLVLFFVPVFSLFVRPIYFEVYSIICIILLIQSILWWFKNFALLKNANKIK